MFHNRSRGRRAALAFTSLAATALLALSASPATAAPAPAAPAGTTSSAGRTLTGARQLNITMQEQQKSNWCWAASGNTIATFYGWNYSQNQFCNAAFGRAQGYDCPNSQATLGDVQNAFSSMGINPGRYVNGYLYYSTVQNEINSGRPVETRIGWTSGGGHMNVLYGYDTSRHWLYWGDPWPSNYRYNWGDFDWYVSNSSFDWTHSLYRIGA
jgi:hypothetical protein